jgi:photosystem II stability/assembly factor-like uncharacterized protein
MRRSWFFSVAILPAFAVSDIRAEDVWTSLNSGTGSALYGISCPSKNVCVAVGASGAIRRTTNGGTTWSSIAQSGTTGTTTYYGVQFFGPDSGYISGDNELYRTVNGGATWTAQLPDLPGMKGLHCANFERCVVAGRGIYAIYNTTNAGELWTGAAYKNGSITVQIYVKEIRFSDPNNVWVASAGGYLLHNTGGGVGSWSKAPGFVASDSLESMFWLNANAGWVGTDSGKIFKTTNAGASWALQSSVVGGDGKVNAIHFVSPAVGYLFGTSSTNAVRKSTDGGATWLSQSVGVTDVQSVAFPDTGIGFAVGSGGKIYKIDRTNPVPVRPMDFHFRIRRSSAPLALDKNRVSVQAGTELFDLNGRNDSKPLSVPDLLRNHSPR